jgi:hypothetical protein
MSDQTYVYSISDTEKYPLNQLSLEIPSDIVAATKTLTPIPEKYKEISVYNPYGKYHHFTLPGKTTVYWHEETIQIQLRKTVLKGDFSFMIRLMVNEDSFQFLVSIDKQQANVEKLESDVSKLESDDYFLDVVTYRKNGNPPTPGSIFELFF